MSSGSVHDWCRQFKNRCIDVRNERGQGCKSIIAKKWFTKLTNCLRKQAFKISDIASRFSKVYRNTLHSILSENLGSQKFCACWVPKQLTDVYKTQRINLGTAFLERLVMEGEEF